MRLSGEIRIEGATHSILSKIGKGFQVERLVTDSVLQVVNPNYLYTWIRPVAIPVSGGQMVRCIRLQVTVPPNTTPAWAVSKPNSD